MGQQLVLIGGGHAHMVTLARLERFIAKGYGVTVIQPSVYHYYSGMGPGMLGGTYQPEDIRFATREQVEAKGGRFVLGRAERIDAANKKVILADSGDEIAYDVLSCNAGSAVPPFAQEGRDIPLFQVKPIEELYTARTALCALLATRDISVAIIGGGPSAVEIAGNIHQLARLEATHRARIMLFAGRKFFAGRPPRVRYLARKILQRKGVEIVESAYVKRLADGVLHLDNRETFPVDIVFSAIGVVPNPIFHHSGLAVGPDGGLTVNQYLQSTQYREIFGGGDCIFFSPQPLDKVGVYAVRQNEVLYDNLMAALEGSSLTPFAPGGRYLLIYNLGDGEGILSKYSLTFSGKLAFRIKDFIDRRFMDTFQQS